MEPPSRASGRLQCRTKSQQEKRQQRSYTLHNIRTGPKHSRARQPFDFDSHRERSMVFHLERPFCSPSYHSERLGVQHVLR